MDAETCCSRQARAVVQARLSMEAALRRALESSQFATGSRAEAIVDAVVRMTNALDVESVAEGIETAEQLEVVSRLGYTFVQGFHLMRPVDGETVRWLLRSSAPAQAGARTSLQITKAQSLLAEARSD